MVYYFVNIIFPTSTIKLYVKCMHAAAETDVAASFQLATWSFFSISEHTIVNITFYFMIWIVNYWIPVVTTVYGDYHILNSYDL